MGQSDNSEDGGMGCILMAAVILLVFLAGVGISPMLIVSFSKWLTAS